MALKTNLTDDQVTEAAARIQSGEAWTAVAREYRVDRCDLSRHFRLLGLEYRRRFYKCQGRKLTIPETVAERAYMAGLFDGEGTLHKQNGRWSFSIANTYRPVIDWLLCYGGKESPKPRYSPKHKPAWAWRVHAQQDVYALTEVLAPYMIIKRDLALRVLAEISSWPYHCNSS
jgi:hypothetical protein